MAPPLSCPGLLQPLRPRQILGQAFGGARQRRFVDQPLVAFHPGHMGVAKQTDPFRRKSQYRLDRRKHTGNGLVRQAVHEIDVDRADAGGAQGRDRTLRLVERLKSIHRALDLGV